MARSRGSNVRLPPAEGEGACSLDDRTIFHLPPHEAAQRVDPLKMGSPLLLIGVVMQTSFPKVVEAMSIGASASAMTDIDRPLPRGPKVAQGLSRFIGSRHEGDCNRPIQLHRSHHDFSAVSCSAFSRRLTQAQN